MAKARILIQVKREKFPYTQHRGAEKFHVLTKIFNCETLSAHSKVSNLLLIQMCAITLSSAEKA